MNKAISRLAWLARLYTCEVKLTDQAQELAPAFEAACLATAGS